MVAYLTCVMLNLIFCQFNKMKMKLLIPLSFLVTLMAKESLQGNCPADWEPFQDNCYLFSDIELSFFGAWEMCWSKKGYLVEVTNAEQNQFLKGKIGKNDVWLAGNDINVENKWQWHGSLTPITYNDWTRPQPDDHRGRQDCDVLWMSNNGHWDDQSCSTAKRFVCQRPVRGY